MIRLAKCLSFVVVCRLIAYGGSAHAGPAVFVGTHASAAALVSMDRWTIPHDWSLNEQAPSQRVPR